MAAPGEVSAPAPDMQEEGTLFDASEFDADPSAAEAIDTPEAKGERAARFMDGWNRLREGGSQLRDSIREVMENVADRTEAPRARARSAAVEGVRRLDEKLEERNDRLEEKAEQQRIDQEAYDNLSQAEKREINEVSRARRRELKNLSEDDVEKLNRLSPREQLELEVNSAREAYIRSTVEARGVRDYARQVVENGSINIKGDKVTQELREDYDRAILYYARFAHENPDEFDELEGLDDLSDDEFENEFDAFVAKTLVAEFEAAERERAQLSIDNTTRMGRAINAWQNLGKKGKAGKAIQVAVGAAVGFGAVTFGAATGGAAVGIGAGVAARFARGLASNYQLSNREDTEDSLRGFTRNERNQAYDVEEDLFRNTRGNLEERLGARTERRLFNSNEAERLERKKANRRAVGVAVASVALGSAVQVSGVGGMIGDKVGSLRSKISGLKLGDKYASAREYFSNNSVGEIASDTGDSISEFGGNAGDWLSEKNEEWGESVSERLKPSQSETGSTTVGLEGEDGTDGRRLRVASGEVPTESIESNGRIFESFHGEVNPGEGATYLMQDMFEGEVSPDQLGDMYLRAVDELGSDGVATLFENASPLDAPIDDFGTVTGFDAGPNGISAEGVRYFTELAEQEGYIEAPEYSPANDTSYENVEDVPGFEADQAPSDAEAGDWEPEAPEYTAVSDLEAVVSDIDTTRDNPWVVAERLTQGAGRDFLIEDAIEEVNRTSTEDIYYDRTNNQIKYVESDRVINRTDTSKLNEAMIEIVS